MHRIRISLACGLLLCALPVASLQAGWNPFADNQAQDQAGENLETREAIARFRNLDPSMKVFFEKAYGYAVFPTVGKGGMGIGGAYGKGEVYARGRLLGYSKLTQVTIGFQLGGQAYSEIIFFKDKRALDDFTSGNFEFSAQASAVAATAGAAANADYSDGVAVFTATKGGLMYEATVGGQKFSFRPAK